MKARQTKLILAMLLALTAGLAASNVFLRVAIKDQSRGAMPSKAEAVAVLSCEKLSELHALPHFESDKQDLLLAAEYANVKDMIVREAYASSKKEAGIVNWLKTDVAPFARAMSRALKDRTNDTAYIDADAARMRVIENTPEKFRELIKEGI